MIRLISLVILLGVLWLPADGLGTSWCPFFILTGVPGPLCGLTRSLGSFLHLKFGAGLGYHPLGALVLFVLVFGAVTNRTIRFEGWLGGESEAAGRRWTAALVIGAFLVTWIVRWLVD